MTEIQKEMLLEAWDWCDDEDKSTEFMIAYLQDIADLSFDEVIDYIASEEAELDRKKHWNK